MSLRRLVGIIHPRVAVMLHDLAMAALAWWVAKLLRYTVRPQDVMQFLWFEFPVVVLAQGLIFRWTGLYKGVWRFASLPDLWNILRAVVLGSAAIWLLLSMFNRLQGVPRSMLPEVKDSSAHFGDSVAELFDGPIAVRGIAGDQQAAVVGQACFAPGMMKSTYGTGCFALLNTGTTPVASKNKLLTTIAYQLNGQRTYALEGSIFVAGSAVQWLRDGLGLIKQAAETGPLADKSDSMQSVYLVPAFVGLGAPYWNPRVRGALFGLTRSTGPAELAHATLESVCYQTFDLWAAMRADWPEADAAHTVLRVDGGMTASDWTMQRLADLLDAPVDRPMIQETTALGAAYLAGLHAGVYPEPLKFADNWRLEHRFKPAMSQATRERKLKGWARAVKGVLASDEGEG